MTWTMTRTVATPYAETVAAVREALTEQGFGVLTEIDLAAKLKEKLDADVAPQIILGACRPELAHEALLADPTIAAVLPCNVVVRALDESSTIVEAFDPDAMMSLAGAAEPGSPLAKVAADARRRIDAMLGSLAPAA